MYFSQRGRLGRGIGVTVSDAVVAVLMRCVQNRKAKQRISTHIMIPPCEHHSAASQSFGEIFAIDYFGTAEHFFGIVIFRTMLHLNSNT